jgi:hypothetical protein
VAETRADMPTVDTVAAEVTAQAGTEEATVAQVAATVEEAAEAEVVAEGETEIKRLKAEGYTNSNSSNPNRPSSSRITFSKPSSTNE